MRTAEKICNGGEYLLREIECLEVFTPEDFSDEHKQIAETTEQFVAGDIMPINEGIEAGNFTLVVEKLKKCAELGLMMIDAPEEYGGLELDKATSMLVMKKMAFALNFGLSYMCHTGIGMLPLIYYGTAEQKERYLGRLIRAEMIGAYCLTEPGSGSDALGAKTTAILSEDGRHYILNGTKQFSTNSGFAGLFTVFAKVPMRPARRKSTSFKRPSLYILKNGQSVICPWIDCNYASKSLQLLVAENRQPISSSPNEWITSCKRSVGRRHGRFL